MRKYKSLILVVAMSLIAGCATNKPTNRQCNRFRTGHFTSHVEGANKFLTAYRNDSLQVEVLNGETDSLKLKVTWLDPCTYELVFLNSEFKGMKIMTRIIETKKDYYIYEAKMEDRDPVSDTMYLVK